MEDSSDFTSPQAFQMSLPGDSLLIMTQEGSAIAYEDGQGPVLVLQNMN